MNITTSHFRVISGSKDFQELVRQLYGYHKRGYVLPELRSEDITVNKNNKLRLSPERIVRVGEGIVPDRCMLSMWDPYHAPEYNRAILKGDLYYPIESGDIYSLMISIYELYLGKLPDTNFQLNRWWTKPLQKEFGCDTDEKKAALQSLMDQCTVMSEYKRVRNCEQLMKSSEYQLLVEGR